MATPTDPKPAPRWAVDLALCGIGAGCIVLGTVSGGTFGDGATVGAGAMALGAGVRGLISQS